MEPTQPNDPELLAYQLDFNKSTIERALDITAYYVSKYKLILTGGTAIDMALRSKGSSIYDENALPDYDIISEDNLKHATALAEILCNEGIRDINVINAIHITTVRVRVKNITLLDATYLPQNLVKQIPYLDIGKFRLVHPNYQKIDQRLSLATLMADTGASLNIFNRMAKDLKRNQILRDYFDIDNGTPLLKDVEEHCQEACSIIPADIKIFTNRVKFPLALLKMDPDYMERIDKDCFVYTGDVCVSGFAAYALFYHEYTKSNKPLDGTINPNVTLTKDFIEFDLPKEANLAFLNCNDKAIDTLKKLSGAKDKDIKKYNELANLKPITVKAPYGKYSIEVIDTCGKRFSAVQIDGMVVAAVDYILMEFLRDRVYGETPYLKSINSLYYDSLLTMVLERQKNSDNKIWFPTISCYGYTLIPEYKAFAMEKIMDPEKVKDYKPKSSYLQVPRCMTKSDFDPALSHYFDINGLENPNIKYTNLKHIVDGIQSAPTKID